MEIGLLLLAATLMFSGVYGDSSSMSCSTVNGKTICERQSGPGNSAQSSSQSFTGPGSPDYQRAYAGVRDSYTGSFSQSQQQRGVAPPSGLLFNPFAAGVFNFDYGSSSSGGYDYDIYSPGPSVDYANRGLPAAARTNDYGASSSGSIGYNYDYPSVSSQDYANGGAPAAAGANDYGSSSFGASGYDYGASSTGSSGYDYDYSSVSSQDYAYGGYPVAAGAFGIATAGSFPISNIPGFGYPQQGFAVQSGQPPPGGMPFFNPYFFPFGRFPFGRRR